MALKTHYGICGCSVWPITDLPPGIIAGRCKRCGTETVSLGDVAVANAVQIFRERHGFDPGDVMP